jgi:HSP20 family protein
MARKAKKVAVKRRSKAEAKAKVPSPRRPRHPLSVLRSEVDRLFDDFSSHFSWPFGRSPFAESVWQLPSKFNYNLPVADITETEKEYRIAAELPALDAKDVEVTLTKDTLSITGEKTDEKEEKKKDYYLSERRYGTFRRSFRLPDEVDVDNIGAEFGNGVLTVTLPKKPGSKTQSKRIAVQSK